MAAGRTALIGTCILMVLWSVVLVSGFVQLTKGRGSDDAQKALFASLVLALTFSIMYIILAVFLLSGIWTKNQIRIWFVGTCFLCVLRLILFAIRLRPHIADSAPTLTMAIGIDHFIELGTLLFHLSALTILHHFRRGVELGFIKDKAQRTTALRMDEF